MTEPPPRKRFQIHLSTAIVMMFVAGGIIWANARVKPTVSWLSDRNEFSELNGWPFKFTGIRYKFAIWNGNGYTYDRLSEVFYGTLLTCDILIALSILLATCLLCEWLIRRRAARKAFNPNGVA